MTLKPMSSFSVWACGGTPLDITATGGTITSPNFPNNYGNDQVCIWRITVPSGSLVQLSFTALELEDHSTCNYDFVEVQNGFGNISPLIGKYCGSTQPPSLTTDGRSIYVKFKSDSSVTFKGFSATFNAVVAPTTQPAGKDLCLVKKVCITSC